MFINSSVTVIWGTFARVILPTDALYLARSPYLIYKKDGETISSIELFLGNDGKFHVYIHDLDFINLYLDTFAQICNSDEYKEFSESMNPELEAVSRILPCLNQNAYPISLRRKELKESEYLVVKSKHRGRYIPPRLLSIWSNSQLDSPRLTPRMSYFGNGFQMYVTTSVSDLRLTSLSPYEVKTRLLVNHRISSLPDHDNLLNGREDCTSSSKSKLTSVIKRIRPAS